MAAQRLKQAFKVSLLHGLNLGQGGFPLLHGFGTNHFPESANPGGVKEHMLSPAQTNALRAEGDSLLSVAGVSALVRTSSRLYLSAAP